MDLSAYGGTFTRCAWIQVDVNGFKPPNILGKDVFAFSLTANLLLPSGAQGLSAPETTCIIGSTDSANTGHGCAAKYLYE